MKRNTLMAFTLFLTSTAWAGDTPFFNYHCKYSRALEKRSFVLQFQNEEGTEEFNWESFTKQTKIRFIQKGSSSAVVEVTTGMPILAHATPEEFRFTAPLGTEKFEFSFTLKPGQSKPNSNIFELMCVRAKPN